MVANRWYRLLGILVILLCFAGVASAQEGDETDTEDSNAQEEPVSEEAAAQEEASAPLLTLSVPQLVIKGEIGEDSFVATFHLFTAGQGVTDVRILQNDLITGDGRRIAANQYALSTVSFASIDANDGESVHVTIPSLPAPGIYIGNLEILYAERTLAERLQLTIVVEASQTSMLELAEGSNRLTLNAPRGGGLAYTDPVNFALRQTGGTPATVSRFNVLGPPDSAAESVLAIPAAAVRISPELPLDMSQNVWQSYAIEVDRSMLEAGEYAAQLVLTTNDGEDASLILDLKLRDRSLYAWVWLGLGIMVSFLVRYMTRVGAARLGAFRDLRRLESRLSDESEYPEVLRLRYLTDIDRQRRRARWATPDIVDAAIDQIEKDLDAWQSVVVELYRIEDRLQNTPSLPLDLVNKIRQQIQEENARMAWAEPSAVAATLETITEEIDKVREGAGEFASKLRDWRISLNAWGQKNDPYVQALMGSPALLRLRQLRAQVTDSLQQGDYDHGTLQGQVREIDRGMMRLAELIPILENIEQHAASNPQLQAALPNLTTDYLAIADDLFDGQNKFRQLISQLEQMTLLKPVVDSELMLPHFSIEAALASGELENLGGGDRLEQPITATTSARRSFRQQIQDWLADPTNYLPWFQMLLQGVFLLLLAFAGMQALYFGKLTFGASGASDYLALFLWGIGADASRKQLTDLESAANFLRERMGVENDDTPDAG
jgi:hypothetical protein